MYYKEESDARTIVPPPGSGPRVGRSSPWGCHSPMIAIRRGESGGGFSVLDGASIVTGAAVASIHIRGVIRGDLAAPGWALIWGTFAGVSLTAAGPFLFLARRFLRRLPDYPGVGDALWALLGLPWLVAALIRSASPPSSGRVATPCSRGAWASGCSSRR